MKNKGGLTISVDWLKLGGMILQKAQENFGECGIKSCDKRSVGIVCSSCSKLCCVDHVYIKPVVPPKPLCVVCVLDSHPEVLEDA